MEDWAEIVRRIRRETGWTYEAIAQEIERRGTPCSRARLSMLIHRNAREPRYPLGRELAKLYQEHVGPDLPHFRRTPS